MTFTLRLTVVSFLLHSHTEKGRFDEKKTEKTEKTENIENYELCSKA